MKSPTGTRSGVLRVQFVQRLSVEQDCLGFLIWCHVASTDLSEPEAAGEGGGPQRYGVFEPHRDFLLTSLRSWQRV